MNKRLLSAKIPECRKVKAWRAVLQGQPLASAARKRPGTCGNGASSSVWAPPSQHRRLTRCRVKSRCNQLRQLTLEAVENCRRPLPFGEIGEAQSRHLQHSLMHKCAANDCRCELRIQGSRHWSMQRQRPSPSCHQACREHHAGLAHQRCNGRSEAADAWRRSGPPQLCQLRNSRCQLRES